MGLILSLSILVDALARRTSVPRISMLVLVGVGIAFVQQVWLTDQNARLLDGLSEPLINLALVMVAFLLGSELTVDRLRYTGPLILVISLFVIVLAH